jgi:RNA-binding proteins (RRM domain)
MTVSIYVGNLPFSTDQSTLQSLFAPYGNVTSAKVMTDRDTGRPRGFGFVEMESSDDAKKAISALDGTELDGRKLRINEAEKRTQRY